MDDKPRSENRKLRLPQRETTEGVPTPKKRKTQPSTSEDTGTGQDRGGAMTPSIQSFPPELLVEILSWLSVRDVVAFGASCQSFRELCCSEAVWRRLCQRQVPRVHPLTDGHWRRAAILYYTRAVYFQALSGRGGRSLSQAVTPPLSLGYRKFLPTKDSLFLLDCRGTLFLLRSAMTPSSRGRPTWRRACRHAVVCTHAKDFASDPRCDVSYRRYLYVLVSRNPEATPGLSPGSPPCDCVEVYQQDTGQRVFKMTFHHSLTFTRLQLAGSESQRSLLLLSDEGKVYSLTVNEAHLVTPRSYTVQLCIRKISHSLPHLPVSQLHTSHSSALYLTACGSVYLELHSAGLYRQLFGTMQGFDHSDTQAPLALSLPSKVVSCSLGFSHLALLDEFGRLFMQGCNRYGQLGTGDKIDRGEPTQVAVSGQAVVVWCGLNHSLVLLGGAEGGREVHGCGCGGGGRLPGCPKGSATFTRLQVRVPPWALSLCSTKDCLYFLCCHDVDKPPLFHEPIQQPRARGQGLTGTGDQEQGSEGEQKSRHLQNRLAEIRECASLQEQLGNLKETVQSHMALSPAHRNFLLEALTTMQRGTLTEQSHSGVATSI
ncbi:F-box only protein 24 isoform X1 [Lepisosteus oculatus]